MPESPSERTHVELPLVQQLVGMGWQHLSSDTDVPYLTERQNFREVVLGERLRQAIRRINVDDASQPWLDDTRVAQAVSALERLGAHKLMEANQAATALLLAGTVVEGDPAHDGGTNRTVRYIDFEHPEHNDFLVINQFRVDQPGGSGYIVPDAVLFVNGIPLVVVECKSPAATNPTEEAITQLLRYSNQRGATVVEGVERLFHYNQLMVATSWFQAVAGAIGAQHEHYSAWKDTSPVPTAEVAAALGVASLSSQQLLVAGMLRPAHLLDLVRNFTLFQQAGGAVVKIVARYQQFRAVHEAVRRLQHGQAAAFPGERDGRGGVIWHTQGSGKSLTMVSLVRKLRTLPGLRRFKVVIVTDRTDLQRQLADTAALTGETVHTATTTDALKRLLRNDGPDLVFGMIQKYQPRDTDGEVLPFSQQQTLRRAAEEPSTYTVAASRTPPADTFETLNSSPDILVLVDEAHRSQANTLHANLMQALPNCARIGFTGTPIVEADRKRTVEIFGDLIDRYTIKQSEADGATVPILYEGRTADAVVDDGRSLDQLFEDMFRERTPAELDTIKRKYATEGNVLEAPKLIAAKAADMLRHYVATVLPNGLKAQVVATSRRAAVRYQREHAAEDRAPDRQVEARFLRLVLEGVSDGGALPRGDLPRISERVIDLVAHIRQEIQLVDFRRNAYAQATLRSWIVTFLDDNDMVAFERQQALADRLVELARHLHTRLIA